MKTNELLDRISKYHQYLYNFIQIEIDSEPLEGVKIFRMTVESFNKIVRASVSYNVYLDQYLLRVSFNDGTSQITKEYKYQDGMSLLQTLDSNIPLYFKDLYPVNTNLKLTREEYLELLPSLAF